MNERDLGNPGNEPKKSKYSVMEQHRSNFLTDYENAVGRITDPSFKDTLDFLTPEVKILVCYALETKITYYGVNVLLRIDHADRQYEPAKTAFQRLKNETDPEQQDRIIGELIEILSTI